MALATIPEAIKDIKAGKFVIVVDDEDRENEGDFVMAAEKVTAESINFMARYGRGLICMPMTGERLDALRIPMMASNNTSHFGTAFTVSVEAKHGTTTGISAADRAKTVQNAYRPQDQAGRHRHAGAHVPPARPGRRRAGTRRANRGDGRPGQAGGAKPGGRLL